MRLLLSPKPFFALSLLLLWLWPAPAGAQVVTAEATASYTFGQSLRFHLEAAGEQPVEAAFLFFNTPELANTYVVEVEVDPARTLSLTHEIPLSQLQLAPFTTVSYWWELAIGDRRLRVEGEPFTYADDRFPWQTRAAENVTVHWTGADPALGQIALDTVAQALPRLQALIPAGPPAPVEIYIYPGTAELRSALRLAGRDWVGADAHPELGVLLVTAVNPRTAAFDLGQSIPHELAHLLLYQATQPAGGPVPRWFEEGVATLAETAPNPDYEIVLRQAVAAGETIPFATLCTTFPADAAQARLAYAQSASFVSFIRERAGNQGVRALVRAFADGAGCETAVSRVLDTSLDRLNAQWLEALRPLSPLERFWQIGGLWLVLLGGGVGLMILLNLPLRRPHE